MRYEIDTNNWTATEVWSWDMGFVSATLGDADLLDNDAILLCAGGNRDETEDAHITEVSADGTEVWDLAVGDDLWVYRAEQVMWRTPSE